MTKKKTEEFNLFIQDILDNKEFNKLNKELHHGITRYEHSLRVAKYSYKIAKLFNMKHTEETTRAALLHDFYLDKNLEGQNSARRLQTHPEMALENSLKYYELNELQQDIIKSHMFPCNLTIPKHKESWLVSMVDKTVGAYEMLRYKTALYAGIYLIFIFQLIKLPNN